MTAQRNDGTGPAGPTEATTGKTGDSEILEALARAAVALVTPGAWVGLGTGRAAAAFIAALGERVRGGLVVTGVPTSEASARQARAAGIPLRALEEERQLELTVDGADEVAPNLDIVKGRGGALVRERIVAAASRRQIILVSEEKLVTGLGARGDIPVELIPMACPLVMHRLKLMGLKPTLRRAPPGTEARDGGGGAGTPTEPFITENGNLTIDCALPAPLVGRAAARELELALRVIPGVIDTGLFLGTCERVLVGHPGGQVSVQLRAAAEQANGGDP